MWREFGVAEKTSSWTINPRPRFSMTSPNYSPDSVPLADLPWKSYYTLLPHRAYWGSLFRTDSQWPPVGLDFERTSIVLMQGPVAKSFW